MKERAEALDRFYRVYDDSEILIYEGEDWNEASDAMQFKGGAVLYSTEGDGGMLLEELRHTGLKVRPIDLASPFDILDLDEYIKLNIVTRAELFAEWGLKDLAERGKETDGTSTGPAL